MRLISAWFARRRLARHLATADMSRRRDQIKAEELRDRLQQIARTEAWR